MLGDRAGMGEGAVGRGGEGGVARFFLAYGLVLWLVATVIFRLFGEAMLSGGVVAMVTLSVLVVPGVAALAYPVYAFRGLDGRGRLLAAVCAVLPGMVLDVIALSFFGAVYSNLSADVAPRFGALLLWAYALILFEGFFPVRALR